ncbi:MAG: lysophospholipid acyltransferase family protein [Deltaproteobacteria bacterium]|jgi:lysophospholipid acyltransferase (LPLAT)-like uncharacterized protein|nr:lysophospholipid acyltransferase family protein [Deltaproteobacteria bacterium]
MSDNNNDGAKYRFFLNWPVILAWLIKLYYFFMRLRSRGYPFNEKGPVIFITWHSEEITILPYYGFSKAVVMASRSKDGEILARVVQKWGYGVTRGSSSRGAVAALLALKRALLNGQNVVLAVDGPRGPRHLAKSGAFWLAAKTGAPIYPVAAASSRSLVFKKSWSKSRLPLPFSKIAVHFEPPLKLDKQDLASADKDRQCAELTSAMENAVKGAADLLKIWPKNCKTSSGKEAEPT